MVVAVQACIDNNDDTLTISNVLQLVMPNNKQVVVMKGTILLVTWLIAGQPPSSYQVEYTTMQQCIVARDAIFAERERLGKIAAKPRTVHFPGPGNASTSYAGGRGPDVSAVCTER